MGKSEGFGWDSSPPHVLVCITLWTWWEVWKVLCLLHGFGKIILINHHMLMWDNFPLDWRSPFGDHRMSWAKGLSPGCQDVWGVTLAPVPQHRAQGRLGPGCGPAGLSGGWRLAPACSYANEMLCCITLGLMECLWPRWVGPWYVHM